jgi:hypothetical protein
VRAFQPGKGGTDHRRGGQQVDGHHALPGGGRHVGEAAGDVSARGGDDAVQVAGPLREQRCRVLGGPGVGEVTFDPRHVTGGWLPVDDVRDAAGLTDGGDDGGAEAAGAAGDENVHDVAS